MEFENENASNEYFKNEYNLLGSNHQHNRSQ